ncbi:hypothetical protein ACYFX5_18825 [Bremerella sp. T1]|uniref:hypothetical protein n=1 Tax=Bremerella sp. TYQ1 TaxID=3119568 RepID=UPI001CCCE411|nr:hypothetical protein [Bremerella volcania]UBM35103.1 hypothetical protein LA756_20775 [Bremerella volcania]
MHLPSCRATLPLVLGILLAMPSMLSAAPSADFEKFLSPILEDAVRRSLPTSFKDESDWNRTHDFTKRLKVRGKWNSLKLERVREAKNHGDWVRYLGHIEDPKQHVQIWIEDLNVGPMRSTCQIHARVEFQGEAEYQQWLRGVRLLGVSVVAEATVKIRLDVQLDSKWDRSKLLSTAEFTPTVTGGQIDLERFYVHRIGKAHGEVAEQIGEQLEGTLVKKVAKQNEKLVREANKAIAKELENGTVKLDLIDYLKKQLAK